MKVEAIQLGYHDHRRRRPGDIFVLRAIKKADGTIISPEQQFSKNWMKKVSDQLAPEFSQRKPEIRPGNMDAVIESQAQHKPIEYHQAEAVSGTEGTESTGTSTGDEDLL